MELRKFIKTTIREYLNEQKLFENSKLNKLLDFEVDEVKMLEVKDNTPIGRFSMSQFLIFKY